MMTFKDLIGVLDKQAKINSVLFITSVDPHARVEIDFAMLGVGISSGIHGLVLRSIPGVCQ
jgi:hypothetical protein